MRFHLLLVVLLVGSVRADDAPPRLRAGAFAMNITPTKFPISVNGNMQDVLATTAHDPLHARCLVLDDGKTKIALVVCDSCMIPRELLDAAKQRASKATGIPTSHMLVSATHAHSAPTVAGVFQSEPDSDYVAFLTEKIAAGIVKAHANLAQAQVGWAVGKDATQVFNRRWHLKPGSLNKDPFDGTTDKVRMNPGYRNADVDRPAGPVDPDVTVLSVRTPQGRPLALLGNYSLHYVGGVPALSADYFGAFADRIQGLLDVPRGEPPFVGILSNGTSGDVNNVDFSGPPPGARKPGERVRLVADSVARAAHEAYRGIKHGDATLSMAEKEIELGVRLPGDAELKRAQEILAEAKKPLKGVREIYARETVLMAKYPKTVKVKLQAVRIGELGIVAIPCEVFTEIGLEIKKKSPLRPTCTIELANGYNGYLPTPQQHQLGGYETWRARSSYLEVDAATKILPVVFELLRRVSR